MERPAEETERSRRVWFKVRWHCCTTITARCSIAEVSARTLIGPVGCFVSTSTNFAALHRDQLCKESGARRQARTRTRRNATRTRRNAALHMAPRISSPMLRSSEGPLSAIVEPLAARPSHAIRFARMRPAGYEIAVVGAESHRRRRADHCVSRRAGTSKYSPLMPSAYSGPCAGRKQRKKRGSYC